MHAYIHIYMHACIYTYIQSCRAAQSRDGTYCVCVFVLFMQYVCIRIHFTRTPTRHSVMWSAQSRMERMVVFSAMKKDVSVNAFFLLPLSPCVFWAIHVICMYIRTHFTRAPTLLLHCACTYACIQMGLPAYRRFLVRPVFRQTQLLHPWSWSFSAYCWLNRTPRRLPRSLAMPQVACDGDSAHDHTFRRWKMRHISFACFVFSRMHIFFTEICIQEDVHLSFILSTFPSPSPQEPPKSGSFTVTSWAWTAKDPRKQTRKMAWNFMIVWDCDRIAVIGCQ